MYIDINLCERINDQTFDAFECSFFITQIVYNSREQEGGKK